MIQPSGSALCLLYLSKSVFRKSLQEVWTGQEGTPWVASQLSTTLVHTSTHNLLHPPIELYPGLFVVTKSLLHNSSNNLLRPPLEVYLEQPHPGCYSRVHRCPWVTMPLEFYQLLLTKMLSQSRPAKAEISMGPLPWCCFALNFAQCDWNWPTPPQAEKDADSLKTSQNCNCDWAPKWDHYFECHLTWNLLCMKLLSQVLIVSPSSLCLYPIFGTSIRAKS